MKMKATNMKFCISLLKFSFFQQHLIHNLPNCELKKLEQWKKKMIESQLQVRVIRRIFQDKKPFKIWLKR